MQYTATFANNDTYANETTHSKVSPEMKMGQGKP